jgi:hypothetical protein
MGIVRLAALIVPRDETGEQSSPGYSYGRGLDGQPFWRQCNPDAYWFLLRPGGQLRQCRRTALLVSAGAERRSDIAPIGDPSFIGR